MRARRSVIEARRNVGIFCLVALAATGLFALLGLPIFVWLAVYGLVAASHNWLQIRWGA